MYIEIAQWSEKTLITPMDRTYILVIGSGSCPYNALSCVQVEAWG